MKRVVVKCPHLVLSSELSDSAVELSYVSSYCDSYKLCPAPMIHMLWLCPDPNPDSSLSVKSEEDSLYLNIYSAVSLTCLLARQLLLLKWENANR